MKALIAPLAAAAGLVAFVAVFLVEATAFRAAVAGWAAHDLRERTRLAAAAGLGAARRIFFLPACTCLIFRKI